MEMQVCTTEIIQEKVIVKNLGAVFGSTVMSRSFLRDIVVYIRNLLGGEIEEYSKLQNEARTMAIEKMIQSATSLGANAIVGLRICISRDHTNSTEILVYGTAVVTE